MASAASQVYDLLEGTVPLAAPQASLQGANPRLKYFSAYNNGALNKATRKKLRGFNKL